VIDTATRKEKEVEKFVGVEVTVIVENGLRSTKGRCYASMEEVKVNCEIEGGSPDHLEKRTTARSSRM